MAQTIELQVARYSPERDVEPYLQRYEVPVKEEWVLLDALNYIMDQLDGTLTFRWSCRMGICGSCGYMVNNEPKLGCATFLTQYVPGPIKIEPLRNFPVVRDLVIEICDALLNPLRLLGFRGKECETRYPMIASMREVSVRGADNAL